MSLSPPGCFSPLSQAQGSWQGPSARDAHMLLQNELFLNVATKDWAEGELRGQVISLPYSGLLARYTGTQGTVAGGWQSIPLPLYHQLPPPLSVRRDAGAAGGAAGVPPGGQRGRGARLAVSGRALPPALRDRRGGAGPPGRWHRQCPPARRGRAGRAGRPATPAQAAAQGLLRHRGEVGTRPGPPPPGATAGLGAALTSPRPSHPRRLRGW